MDGPALAFTGVGLRFDDPTPVLDAVDWQVDPGLRGGRVVASGPLEEALTSDTLSAAFDLPVALQCLNGRWLAFRR